MSDSNRHFAGSTDSDERAVGTVARVLAATAILIGGLVHLQLYFDGYRSLPDPNLGRSFIANGLASVVVAAVLVWRREALVRLAGMGIAVGTLGAFFISRTDRGIFGLREVGLHPSPQAAIALVTELFALAVLAASFLPALGAGRPLPRNVSLLAAGSCAVAALGLSIVWANSDRPAVAAATAPGNVTIANFAFDAPEITVTKGQSITWTNTDGFAHSIVAKDGSFKSENITTGAAFTHAFDTAGSFTYVCGIHPSMAGTVVVTG